MRCSKGSKGKTPDSFPIINMFVTACNHKRHTVLTITWFRNAESFIDVIQHAAPRQHCSISSIMSMRFEVLATMKPDNCREMLVSHLPPGLFVLFYCCAGMLCIYGS
jgi:hypothetical protein